MDTAQISHRTLTPRRRRVPRGERGQMLVLVGFVLFLMLGLAAMTVDLGAYMGDRRDLQNDVDAMALAGARDLPDEAAAVSSANVWAVKNGIVPGDSDLDNGEIDSIEVYQQSLPDEPNPRVSVTLKRNHGFIFARVLGISSGTVEATASAVKTSPGGGTGVLPLTVKEEDVPPPPGFGEQVVLKYDAQNVETGNFGPVRIDGSGASVYEDGMKYGSDSVVCADTTTAGECQETSPECDGPECLTEPGNMTGPTSDGIDHRMDNTADECNDFTGDNGAFVDNGDGTHYLKPECNPFLAGGEDSLRVVLIPIIDELCNGSCEVTIKGFALFYLEGYDSGKCSGNDCEIKGRFVKAHVNVGALTGVYDSDGSIQFVRLVQ